MGYVANADLDGVDVMNEVLKENPDAVFCWFCLHEATTRAPIGPDRDVPVCGLHS